MKKILSIFIGVFYFSWGYAQIGVNTPIPTHPFHVDGANDNPFDKLPSATEALNDFVINKEGYVGMGISDPKVNLDINGKFRLVDGNQAEGNVMMSDNDGNMKWTKTSFFISTVVGKWVNGDNTYRRYDGVDAPNTFWSIGLELELPKGTWIVNAGVALNTTKDKWLRGVLSTNQLSREQDGFLFKGLAGANTSYGLRTEATALVNPALIFHVLSGSCVIEVTKPSVKIYFLVEKLGIWEYNPGSFENYFYAVPAF